MKDKNNSEPTASEEAQETFAIQQQKQDAEIKRSQRKQEIGWLGRFWGSKPEKNITGLVLVLSFLAMAVLLAVYAYNKMESDFLSTAISGLFSIITLALGYIFGSRR